MKLVSEHLEVRENFSARRVRIDDATEKFPRRQMKWKMNEKRTAREPRVHLYSFGCDAAENFLSFFIRRPKMLMQRAAVLANMCSTRR